MYIILTFSLLAGALSQECKWIEGISGVSIKMRLDKSGFHRDLQVISSIASEQRFMECQLLYRIRIPAGAYIDMNSVNKSMNHHTVYLSTKFDIEAPSEASKDKAVRLYGHRTYRKVFLIENTFTLPVHLRYHKAVANGEGVDVIFRAPEIFVKCSPDRDDSYAKCTKGASKFPCDAFGPKPCEWLRISKNSDEKVTATMPRGNLDHLNMVSVVTFLFIFSAVIYLIVPVIKTNLKKPGVSEPKMD
ncbi:hypothetical protein QR680_017558 [Steinernema hermaphroditum]|uniref:Phosphatidylinositol-glycan biosynthesis class X protein n=1 Tax=Steinernema hermaphroditum TaxID=289476 RepID=A0AA39HFZ9_9BILA|nr:hypothetical protein QR680_017558 [Steinernema hermaphroditum]